VFTIIKIGGVRQMRERVVLKEKSHLLASGPLQRSRQLKEPTKCS